MVRERINIAPSSGTSRQAGEVLSATLTGARTVTEKELNDYRYFAFDPGGAARTVTLPAESASKGAELILKNTADAAEIITVNDDASALVCSVAQDEAAYLWCDGTSWYGGALPEVVGAVAPGEITLARGEILRGNSSSVAAAHAAKTSGQILVGDGTDIVSVAVSGDVTLASSGAVTIAAGAVEQSMIAAASLDGTVAKVAASENVIGAVPVIHVFTVDGGANDTQAITLTHKTRIIDFLVVLGGAGTGSGTVTLSNAGTAISNAIDISAGGDEDVFRPAEMDDAQDEVAAAAALEVVTASAGGDTPPMIVYVTGIRVA